MMKKPPFSNLTLLLAIVLMFSGAFFRVGRMETGVTWLPNFAPLMAIALCAGWKLRGPAAWAVPFAALLASDLWLNTRYGMPVVSVEMLTVYACYALAVGAGILLARTQAGLFTVFGVVIGNALLFYLITNTAAWITLPGYSKTTAGWLQALTTGLPGHPPTWMFFRNSLVSDLFFTGIFATLFHFAEKPVVNQTQEVSSRA